MLTSEVLYDEETGKLIMSESEYNDMQAFISDFKIGAIGLIFTKDETIPVVVRKIIRKSDCGSKIDDLEWNPLPSLLDGADYFVEFITDNDCYLVGFDKVDKDRIIVPCYC